MCTGFPGHTCTKQSYARAPTAAFECRGIHAKTLITSVLQLHSVIGASKLHSLTQHPSPEHKTSILTAIGYQSLHAQTMTITPPCSKSIWRPEHPCPNHNNVRVLTAFGFQSIPPQTMNDSLRQTIQLSQNSVANTRVSTTSAGKVCMHGMLRLPAKSRAGWMQDDFLKAA